jgi:alpha-N-arabinofuranosidase
VVGDSENYHFEYSLDGNNFINLGKLNTRYISTEVAGGFTGVMIGMHCTKNSPKSQVSADFSYFDYIPKK